MGTFHQGKGDLHGITVVVDTTGPEIYVGRCHEVTPAGVLLHDVDVHEDGAGGRSKEQWVAKAAEYGVWKKYDHWLVPADRVTTIRRLSEM